jgi:hypothetical protein
MLDDAYLSYQTINYLIGNRQVTKICHAALVVGAAAFFPIISVVDKTLEKSKLRSLRSLLSFFYCFYRERISASL